MNKSISKTYRTTNWPSYNRALINRGNISIWFDPKTQWYAQPQGRHGRNQTYSDTAIQCCLMIKSLFRLSLRMVTGFVQSIIQLSGLSWTAPDYSTLCRRQKQIDIAISYQKSHEGLHLLVDSTGLKFLGEGEWKRKKHQPEYRRQWRKLHIAIDAETLQIRAVQLTTNNELLRTVKYLGRMLWKKWAGYHRRSLVETKMHCIKLLGDKLSARNFQSQVNEIHARVAVLNRFTELGRPHTQVTS